MPATLHQDALAERGVPVADADALSTRQLADVRVRNAVQGVENACVELKVAMRARDQLNAIEGAA